MKLFNFLLHSHIFISLGAVFLAVETQVQLGMHPQWHPYLFIIFFATLVDYNFHRLITMFANREALNAEKHRWLRENRSLFFVIMGLSVLGFLVSILEAKRDVLIALTPIAFITLFYTLPLIKIKNSYFRLRDIPYLKIFLIASVWSMVTIFLPIIQTGLSYGKEHVALMLTERFLFIFAIAIPFDIRDLNTDRELGLRTIPVLLGEKNATRLASFSLLLFSLICLGHYGYYNLGFLLPAYIFSAITTILILHSSKLRKLPFYYLGILDGTLLMKGLLVYFCFLLK